jgi:hypothetical protein
VCRAEHERVEAEAQKAIAAADAEAHRGAA